jgi:hypothetical protein
VPIPDRGAISAYDGQNDNPIAQFKWANRARFNIARSIVRGDAIEDITARFGITEGSLRALIEERQALARQRAFRRQRNAQRLGLRLVCDLLKLQDVGEVARRHRLQLSDVLETLRRFPQLAKHSLPGYDCGIFRAQVYD